MPTVQEKIDRYLTGEMTETERAAFESDLQQDQELSQTLALQRAMQTSLGNRPRRQLLDALADVVEQEDAKRPPKPIKWFSPFWLSIIITIVIAIIGTWFYLQPGVETVIPAEQPVPTVQPTVDSSSISTPPAQKDTQSKPKPIASADPAAFRPNPALDPLVGTLVRGGSNEISVELPKNDAVLPLRDGKVNFILKGQATEDAGLSFHIYDNQEAHFIASKPVYKTDLAVRDHVFTYEANLKLVFGRYYGVLYAPGEDEPAAVMRFFVGKKE